MKIPSRVHRGQTRRKKSRGAACGSGSAAGADGVVYPGFFFVIWCHYYTPGAHVRFVCIGSLGCWFQ